MDLHTKCTLNYQKTSASLYKAYVPILTIVFYMKRAFLGIVKWFMAACSTNKLTFSMI